MDKRLLLHTPNLIQTGRHLYSRLRRHQLRTLNFETPRQPCSIREIRVIRGPAHFGCGVSRAASWHHGVFALNSAWMFPAKSLFENCVGSCGERFWRRPRRRGRSIPAAGYDDRANAGLGQKSRRPKGFCGNGRLALLLLSRRSTRDMGFSSPAHWFPDRLMCAVAHSSLPRRASPSGHCRKNRTPRNFQTGSYSGRTS